MQSTHLFLVAQRCSSASRISHLLRRCFAISNATTKLNLNNHFSSSPFLVDSNFHSCATNGVLLLLRRSDIINIRQHLLVRYVSSSSLPSYKRITLPALSPTMKTGTLRSWSKREGEKISEGDVLAEIETDKATFGFESSDDGYLAKILIPAGSKDVSVGKLCGIIVEKEEDIVAFKDFKDDDSVLSEKKKELASEQSVKQENTSTKKDNSIRQKQKEKTPTHSSDDNDRFLASPLARKIAQEKSIDLEFVRGTGPNGRIVVEDIEKLINEDSVKVKQETRNDKDAQTTQSKRIKQDKETVGRINVYDEQQISELQAENTRRVTESKTTIPHYYLTIDIELDEIFKLRNKLNETVKLKIKDSKETVHGFTVNDFIVKAAALACKKRPETNSVWMDKSIRQYETVDINVTMSTDTGALVMPIIYNANQKGVSLISKEMSQLSEKANTQTLNADELELGTFTISNLGMYGITNFSAIIYPQQSAILAVGGIDTKILPIADSPKGFRQTTVLNVTLACDHRVIDAAVGAQWLQEFKQFLENPGSMIL